MGSISEMLHFFYCSASGVLQAHPDTYDRPFNNGGALAYDSASETEK